MGYCGADLKALVTEASLAALRRRYPQIYNSEQKLLVDPQEVRVERRDFISALRNITPASHRAAASPARPLPGLVAPVLLPHLQAVLAQVHSIFPPAAACMRRGGPGGGASGPSAGIAWPGGAAFAVQRPRLLICGPPGSGQGHLGPALLYALEGLPAHTIGLPSLLTDPGARSPEEALVHAVAEARRAAPAVLYLPHLETWWATAPASLQATLWTLLADVPPDLPLLLLGTANVPTSHLHREVLELFGRGEGQYDLPAPTHDQRMQFFKPLAVLLAAPPAEDDEADEAPPPPQLPVAPEAHAQEEAARAEAARAAARRRYEDDQAALRTLRMILRSVVSKQLQNRKWEAFWEPVHPEDDPEYWQAVAHPMDLTTLLDRIDRRRYTTPAQFLADVALIPEGERQFWGKDPSAEGLRAISKASQLEDDTRAMVEAAVRLELTQKLESIVARGGPAPAPEGLYEEMGLAADGTLAQPARPERGSGAVADGTGAARRTARLAGEDVDRHLLHRDPEAERRRLKAQKRELEAQQAEAADAEERALVETAGRGVQEDAGNAEEGSRGVLAASTRGNLPDAGIAPLPKPAAELSSGRPGHEGSAGGEEGGGEEQEGGAVLVQGGMYAAAPERELSAEEAAQAEKVQRVLTDRTMPLRLAGLEDVHACAARGAWECRTHRDRSAAIAGVLRAVEEYVRRISAR